MKTYQLAPISTDAAAGAALSKVLLGQTEPWLLKDATDGVIAYFSLVESDDVTGVRTITADMSGRHYDRDEEVMAVLYELQAHLGGNITGDA